MTRSVTYSKSVEQSVASLSKIDQQAAETGIHTGPEPDGYTPHIETATSTVAFQDWRFQRTSIQRCGSRCVAKRVHHRPALLKAPSSPYAIALLISMRFSLSVPHRYRGFETGSGSIQLDSM